MTWQCILNAGIKCGKERDKEGTETKGGKDRVREKDVDEDEDEDEGEWA